MLNKDILGIIGRTIYKDKNINLKFFRNIFNNLTINKQKFKSAYLILYIYENFCKNDDIRKRKTSARDFEDFLSVISGGVIADKSSRSNSNIDNIFVENEFITEWVINNKREKADIFYNNDYKITVKTLIDKNKEINMGAFEKKALFSELNVVEYLEERISSKDGIGLGSKPQLLKLLELIEKNGDWNKFSKRFIKMSNYIYSDDIILFIKSSENSKIYLIDSKILKNRFKECTKSPNDFILFINRWEGNNIRINRDFLLYNIKPILLNFEYLTQHIITKINSNLSKITRLFILYIEDFNNRKKYKNEIIKLCEKTIKDIDINIKELI